jgi:hypothetical protein
MNIDAIEIAKLVFYVIAGLFILGLTIYFLVSPFALIIGLFKPSVVLSKEEPKTRCRVLLKYGISTAILSTFITLSSTTVQNKVYATNTYSEPDVAETSVSSPTIQEFNITNNTEETWINVRNDRAIKVTNIETVDRISPNNEFMKPVEEKGGQLVVVYMTLKNTGEESGNMIWTKFQLIDSLGRKYDTIDDFEENISINTWLKKHQLEDAGIQMFPGATSETAKVFRVAPDASDFKIVVNGKSFKIN